MCLSVKNLNLKNYRGVLIMNQIKCSTCLCASVCKYKEMGISEALKDFELNSQLQKFSSCLPAL